MHRAFASSGSYHIADLERGLDTTLACVRAAPIPDVVRALIEANVASHLVDPELHRVLSTEVPQLGPTDATTAFERRATARVRALLESRRRELAIRDLDLATYLIMRTVEATIHEAVVERPRDLASGAIAREVTRLLLNYLTGVGVRARVSSPAPRSSAPRPRRTEARPGTASPPPGCSPPKRSSPQKAAGATLRK